MTDSYLDATKIISDLGLIRLELANLRKEVAKLQERQAPVYHVGPITAAVPAYSAGWNTTCTADPERDKRLARTAKFIAEYTARKDTA